MGRLWFLAVNVVMPIAVCGLAWLWWADHRDNGALAARVEQIVAEVAKLPRPAVTAPPVPADAVAGMLKQIQELAAAFSASITKPPAARRAR